MRRDRHALSTGLLAGASLAMGLLFGCGGDSTVFCPPTDPSCATAIGGDEDAGGSTGGGGGGRGTTDAGSTGGGGTTDTGRGGGGGGTTDTGGGGGGVSPCDTRTCDETSAAGDPLTDTDGDGIPDCIEGTADIDADGAPACNDADADGDGMADVEEGFDDPDGDGIPNFLDTDSDGDGVPDRYEGEEDPDEDGLPNWMDDDSDGDGIPDSIEYGRVAADGGPPTDRDGDGDPDFLDLDADGDGIPDAEEPGCPEGSDWDNPDSDGDGYSDLIETAFGSNACDPESDINEIVDFYFELPYMGDEARDTLEFGTAGSQGDVHFNMDTTGSMGGEISQLQSSLTSVIIPQLAARLPSAAYAFSQFDDFPCGSYGGGSDRPYILRQRITTDVSAAQRGVTSLERHGGGDYFESGFEALYQIATGEGWSGGCTTIPPFNPGSGFIEGVADGEIGGSGFREGSIPIVVHITDAPSHAQGEGGYPYGHSREQTFTALESIGARVIGVASGDAARSDLEQISRRTRAVVPACAWDAARPGGCSPGQCCTGRNGAGRGSDGDGTCPLVFDIDSGGGGLDTAIVTGIDALINYAPIDVTTRVRRDEDEFAATGIDTSMFLKRVEPLDAIAGPAACAGAGVAVIADFDGDGVNDGFRDVSPGSTLLFGVEAWNDFVRPLDEPQVFIAYIDVMGGGAAVLDTRIATILVPPDIKR